MTAHLPDGRTVSVVRTALVLLPIQVVFRAGEAALPVLYAAWFGRSPETDVFYFCWAYFTFAGSLIASAFHDSALVPILTQVQLRDQESFAAVAGSLLAHTLALGGVLAVVMGALLLLWLNYRYEGHLFAVAASMTVPFVAYIFVVGIRSFFVGLLNARHVYTGHPVASGIGVLVTLGIAGLWQGSIGVAIVPVAAFFGELVAVGVLAWIAIGLTKIRITLSLAQPEAVRRFAKLVASEVSGSAVTRINPVIDQLIASFSVLVGGGTLLRYAFDVASLPTSIVQATVLPVLLSKFSHHVSGNELDEFRLSVRRALVVVCTLLAAMSVVLGFARAPLLELVFLHGEMDAAGVARIAEILPYALVGTAPFGALLILARAHVALQNSRIMFSMGIINAGLNALFNVVFFQWIGLRGIALSTSVMQLSVAILFWGRLRARLVELARPESGR